MQVLDGRRGSRRPLIGGHHVALVGVEEYQPGERVDGHGQREDQQPDRVRHPPLDRLVSQQWEEEQVPDDQVKHVFCVMQCLILQDQPGQNGQVRADDRGAVRDQAERWPGEERRGAGAGRALRPGVQRVAAGVQQQGHRLGPAG